jgi:flagellar basal-body rod modification protein FlgD
MSVSGITSSQSVSDLLSPTASAAVARAKAAATAKTTSSSSSSGTGLTDSATGTEFLNLLVQELQNQDPTAPMDSTAMVGQMISLNQLDQLISINSTLTTDASSSSASSGATKGSATANVAAAADSSSSSSLMTAKAELLNSASPSTSSSAAAQAALDPNSPLDLSKFTTSLGGK